MANTSSTKTSDTAGDSSPAARRRARVRQAILSAAERVFAKEGAEGLSIRRLANAIDYSPAAIYKYFASKEELLKELKESFFERLCQQLDLVRAQDLSPKARLKMSIATYIQTALAKPHHYSAAFSGAVSLDESKIEEFQQEFADSFGGKSFYMLCEAIDEAHDGQQEDPTATGVAARSLWASMHGLALLLIHHPGFTCAFPDEPEFTQEEFIEKHAEILMAGVAH